MQVKPRFFTKHTSRITPKMLQKSVQNGAKKGPRTIPNSFPKICRQRALFCALFGVIFDLKKKPEIRRNRFGYHFFQLKKMSIFRSCCFSFFTLSRKPWTLKIKQKRCKGMQKRGSHLFPKNLDFIKKCTKNDLPLGPQKLTKLQKNEKRPFQN